ncbi:KilA-N domain-containing protein [Alistipes intestinihominis]|uniref:KilA-N domain-containing protein n=1 Tax=Alistipes intestinihominis TaxID=3133172 RepID=A0ABV1GUF4_9BACT
MDKPANIPDDFFNATKICKIFKKEFKTYYVRTESKKLFQEIRDKFHVKNKEIIRQIGTNVWVHPIIAINMAQWASPKIAVEIAQQKTDPITILKKVAEAAEPKQEPLQMSEFDMRLKKALEFNPRK